MWTIDEWFDDWLGRKDADPFRYDNHIRPMVELVPEGPAFFRMEEGLAPVVAHLDHHAGNTDGARTIAPENVRKKKMAGEAQRLTPSPETRARIADFYAEDCRRFGYAIDDVRGPAHPTPKPTGTKALVGALTGRRG